MVSLNFKNYMSCICIIEIQIHISHQKLLLVVLSNYDNL